MKTDFYNAQVGYSFLKNDRAELGIGAGVHVVDFDVTLKVSGNINGIGGSTASDSADLTAPLPDILGYGIYALTPRLSLHGRVSWFSLDYDKYDGNLVTVVGALEYRVTDHVGIGAAYNYVDMDLDIDQSSRTDKYNLEYKGPLVYLSAGF